MRLSDEEQAMLAGEFGEPRRWAIAHQIAVGEFFDAADFVPVVAGAHHGRYRVARRRRRAFSRRPRGAAESERRVRIPTLTDPRGLDVQVYKRLGQSEDMRGLEARAIAALKASAC